MDAETLTRALTFGGSSRFNDRSSLGRYGTRWPALLVGVGAVVYWSGAIPLFAVGPQSPVIQVLEVAGAVPFALGFVLLGRRWGQAEQLGPAASSTPADPSVIVP